METNFYKIEYWIKPWGEIVETIQNPCGCHPFDVIKTYENKKSVAISYTSRKDFLKHMQQNNWELLK